ncbi:MAG TPA: pyridoxal phosphate-dependent aminotransferase [Acidimicrobiales bacterium]|nr:pyridoxal phosphate-dependent aminotransferase [Acidimicrobiales bacterium]
MEIGRSNRLAGVAYDVRGPIQEEASRLEAQGRRVIPLNIGNPAHFGFEAPPELIAEVARRLPEAEGYGDAKGIEPARRAIAAHYRGRGVAGTDADHVYVGNGVSELVGLALLALLNEGDEVLVPAPDYPLWTATVRICGAKAVHYLCDEQADWWPDLSDLATKVTSRTRAVVVINPNNPTGAVYPAEVLTAIAELARQHDLVVLADEIYERLLYDGAEHVPMASVAPDRLCLSFGGLSKAYRLAGFRCGWLVVSGPTGHARGFLSGLDVLADLRLCANLPAQYAVEAALEGYQSIDDLVRPGGRLLEQRNLAWAMLNQIDGVSCVKPAGAMYVFPRLHPSVHPVEDDRGLVLELLRATGVFVVPGSGFNWPRPDHLRIVTLAQVELLEEAIAALSDFLGSRRPY